MADDILSLEVKAFKTINVGQDDEDDVPMAIHNVDVEDGIIYIYVKDLEEVEDSSRYEVLLWCESADLGGYTEILGGGLAPLPLDLAMETGAVWVSRFPEDIVMLVEEEGNG